MRVTLASAGLSCLLNYVKEILYVTKLYSISQAQILLDQSGLEVTYIRAFTTSEILSGLFPRIPSGRGRRKKRMEEKRKRTEKGERREGKEMMGREGRGKLGARKGEEMIWRTSFELLTPCLISNVLRVCDFMKLSVMLELTVRPNERLHIEVKRVKVNQGRPLYRSMDAVSQPASSKNTGNENHAYFHESWGRKVNLIKHIFALYGLYLSFS